MADRVAMGDLGSGVMGIKVSRPGIDVLTASDDDLMLSTDIDQIQIVASGRLTSPGSTNDIAIPNLGFSPFVICSWPEWEWLLSFPNATTVRISQNGQKNSLAPSMPNVLTYIVLNRPIA